MIYQWREVLDEEEFSGETRIMMSEAYANETFTMKYYESADGLRQGSHMPFNFVLINELNEWSTAADFKRVIDSRIKALPAGRMTNWVIGNHDQPRVASRYGSDKIDGLLTLVMTLPGIAVTYNVSLTLFLVNRFRREATSRFSIVTFVLYLGRRNRYG